MKYIKILLVAAFLTLSLEFASAESLTPAVESTFLPPPRPPLPFNGHHRRHHRARIHIRLPKPPPPPPAPPRP
jgi:hypothetical protein